MGLPGSRKKTKNQQKGEQKPILKSVFRLCQLTTMIPGLLLPPLASHREIRGKKYREKFD